MHVPAEMAHSCMKIAETTLHPAMWVRIGDLYVMRTVAQPSVN